jgi:hypothetical protein
MAQRTRTTTARATVAGAAMILAAGLTGCMNDGPKPIRPVGPGPNQTQTKTGTGTPGYPSGPGSVPAATTGTYPQAGMGSGGFGMTQPPANLSQPGMPGMTPGVPARTTTGTGAGPGAPIPGSTNGGFPAGGMPAYNTNPTAMPPASGSLYGGSSAVAPAHAVPEMANPPYPPQNMVPSTAPVYETAPPTPLGPVAPQLQR